VIRIGIQRMESNPDLPLPALATEGAAGFDLRSADPDFVLDPGERRTVGTGLRIEIPPGYEGQVRPRSGLAVRHGVTVANAPGTIDSDYRGEVRVGLIHLGEEPLKISRGDRIAQIVFAPVAAAALVEMDVLSESDRGERGFGSTGRV
jgi:dUTP pyrophosphatase